MILYNLRANGPFEYDKFMLNIGQLHNQHNNIEKIYTEPPLLEKNQSLTEHIQDYVLPKEAYANKVYDNWIWRTDKEADSWLNYLTAIRKAVQP